MSLSPPPPDLAPGPGLLLADCGPEDPPPPLALGFSTCSESIEEFLVPNSPPYALALGDDAYRGASPASDGVKAEDDPEIPGGKQRACKICGKVFNQPGNLSRHYVVHSQTRYVGVRVI